MAGKYLLWQIKDYSPTITKTFHVLWRKRHHSGKMGKRCKQVIHRRGNINDPETWKDNITSSQRRANQSKKVKRPVFLTNISRIGNIKCCQGYREIDLFTLGWLDFWRKLLAVFIKTTYPENTSQRSEQTHYLRRDTDGK